MITTLAEQIKTKKNPPKKQQREKMIPSIGWGRNPGVEKTKQKTTALLKNQVTGKSVLLSVFR